MTDYLHNIPTFSDPRGSLAIIEGHTIPFAIERIFYVFNVQSDQPRGNHAHKTLQQFLICLHGNLEIEVDNGKNKTKHVLNTPSSGVYIPAMHWATEYHFSPDAVYIVLADQKYDPSDYLHDYLEFLTLAKPDER
jgi:hypothetical protein